MDTFSKITLKILAGEIGVIKDSRSGAGPRSFFIHTGYEIIINFPSASL